MIAEPDMAAAEWLIRDFLAEEGRAPSTDLRSDPAVAETEAVWIALGALKVEDFDLSASAPPPLWRRRETQLGGLAALAACLVAAVWLHGRTEVRVFSTGAGEQRVVALEDGSRLELNTRSRLEVRITPDQRRVRLVEGEVLFTVATRPDRQPFTVEAGAARVAVTGTQFNVRKMTHQTRVDLLEGRVEVRGAEDGPLVRLKAGQAVKVSAAGTVGVPEAANVARVRDWRAGRVTLTRSRLDAAALDMNRYAHTPVVLADPSLGELSVDGVFEARDTLAFARAVATLHGLSLSEQGDRLILSRR